MHELEPRFLNVDGIETSVIQGGSGSVTVVFLHGAIPGVTPYVGGNHLWAGTLERFAGHSRVVAIDMLGSGLTAHPSGSPLKLPDMIAHAAATLGKLGVTRSHVIGHDLGGLVALSLGMAEKGPASSLSIVASSFSTPIGDAWEDLTLAYPPAPLFERDSQRWVFDRLSSSTAHIDDALMDGAVRAADSDGVKKAVESMSSAEARAAFTASHVRIRGEMWARARDRGYPLPVQIIWGIDDPLTTVAHGHILLAAIGRKQIATQFHLMNEAGHFPFREQPAHFERIVAAFMAGIAAAPTA